MVGTPWAPCGKSQFFDRAPDNDRRSVGAFAAVWRPPQTTGGRVGLSRVVILADDAPLSALFAPLGSVGRLTAPTLNAGSRDQITSLWTRWAPPGVGFERGPSGPALRNQRHCGFLESPGHSQGYTVGLQWARRLHSGSARL